MTRNTLGPVRCKAHSSRTGKECQQWAIRGGTVCVTHGGSAPQVKFSADERIQALVPLAFNRIEALIESADQDSVSLSASKDILDRAGLKAPDKIDLNARVSYSQLSDDDLNAQIATLQSRTGAAPRATERTEATPVQD